MGYLIINGDSRRFLSLLESVDAVVSDPPYGIGYQHAGGGLRLSRVWSGRNSQTPIEGDDKPFDPTPWLHRACLLWGSNHFAASVPAGGSWIAWDKSRGIGPEDSFVDAEFAWCSIPKIKRNVIGYLWKGVTSMKAGESNGQRFHPTQKPLGVMRRCFQLMNLPPNSLILDPFMGSGSTVIAALAEGHRAIGIEIDPRYCDIARRRIERPHARIARPGRVEELPLFAGD